MLFLPRAISHSLRQPGSIRVKVRHPGRWPYPVSVRPCQGNPGPAWKGQDHPGPWPEVYQSQKLDRPGIPRAMTKDGQGPSLGRPARARQVWAKNRQSIQIPNSQGMVGPVRPETQPCQGRTTRARATSRPVRSEPSWAITSSSWEVQP